jgi:hypothetical protein
MALPRCCYSCLRYPTSRNHASLALIGFPNGHVLYYVGNGLSNTLRVRHGRCFHSEARSAYTPRKFETDARAARSSTRDGRSMDWSAMHGIFRDPDSRCLAAAVLCTVLCLSCGADSAPGSEPTHIVTGYRETHVLRLETAMGEAELYIDLPETPWKEVWFYFHGAGAADSARESVAKRFIKVGSGALPAIVSVTFGPTWFLVGPTERQPFSSSAIFWEQVLPLALRETGTSVRYVGIGYSMGGFNLLSLFADRPSFWDALVLINPAIADLSPNSSRSDLDKYVARTRSYTFKQGILALFGVPRDQNIRIIIDAWRGITRSEEVWSRVSPLRRIAALPGRGGLSLPILIACGVTDEFGFAEGSRLLAGMLAKDPALETLSRPGGHLDIPWREGGEFLARTGGR